MSPEGFIESYKKAMASQQWANVEPLIHPKATVLFTTGTYIGRLAIQEAIQHNFDTIQEDSYSISNIHWIHVDERNATCIFEFHWEGIVKGSVASGCGQGNMVLVKEDEDWQLMLEHLSLRPT